MASAKNEESSKKGSSKSLDKTDKASATKPLAANESKSMSATAEEVALSNSFSGNKGRLPWPVPNGTITGSFGEHAHPEYKNIKVRNNGIDITVPSGSQARAVFEGVVSSVMSITNLHYVVIIRHGDYLSVYSNLQSVSVKKGDKIKTKQSIGLIYSDPEVGKTILHFEICMER